MIVDKKQTRGIEIDLTGPQGNAFFDEMVDRMRSGDYENLIKVFDDEFGSVVTLLR